MSIDLQLAVLRRTSEDIVKSVKDHLASYQKARFPDSGDGAYVAIITRDDVLLTHAMLDAPPFDRCSAYREDVLIEAQMLCGLDGVSSYEAPDHMSERNVGGTAGANIIVALAGHPLPVCVYIAALALYENGQLRMDDMAQIKEHVDPALASCFS